MKKIQFVLYFLLITVLTNFSYAQPCLKDFQFRRVISIDNSSSISISDYQLKLNLNTLALIQAGKLDPSGNDLRILDEDGNALDFWINPATINTSATEIWVKLNQLSANAKEIIYLFYGNSTATSVSSAQNTFILYDDFNGSSLSANWTVCGTGSVNVANSVLELSSTTSNPIAITYNQSFDMPLTIDARVKSVSGNKVGMGFVNSSTAGYGMFLNNSNIEISAIASNSTCIDIGVINSKTAGNTAGQWIFQWDGLSALYADWPGNDLGTNNSTNTASTVKANIAALGTNSKIEIEYLLLRKTPVVGLSYSFGSEVNSDFTIDANYVSPLCQGDNLELFVNNVVGAEYKWIGPRNFTSGLQNPIIPVINIQDTGNYIVSVEIPDGCVIVKDTVNVKIIPFADGGRADSNVVVCNGINNGKIHLKDYLGTVVGWESANSPSGPWSVINTTDTFIEYNNLSDTTYYRAIVQNGGCSTDSSDFATVFVLPNPVGGRVIGAPQDSLCSNKNSGLLFLEGETGTVDRWEVSRDDGQTWVTINNRSKFYNFADVNPTSLFRAVVKVDECDSAYSIPDTVFIRQGSDAGSLQQDAEVCDTSIAGLLNLFTYIGDILRWETRVEGTNWTSISNTSDTQSYSVDETTYYRAIVKFNDCPEETSNEVKIWVADSTIAGTLIGTRDICMNGNDSGRVLLIGNLGSVEKWQSKNPQGNWIDLFSSSNFIDWKNPKDTTFFRAIVKNGPCPSDTSDFVAINVNDSTIAGKIVGDTQVCEGMIMGSLHLFQNVGSVVSWDLSEDSLQSWQSNLASSDTFNFTILNNTQFYRAFVKNGECPGKYTDTVSIDLSESSNAGNIVGIDTFCNTNKEIIQTINSIANQYSWEASQSLNGSYSLVKNQDTFYTIKESEGNWFYRVIAKNGVCPPDTSIVFNTFVWQGPRVKMFISPPCTNLPIEFIDSSSGRSLDRLWTYNTDFNTDQKSFKRLITNSNFDTVSLYVIDTNGCFNQQDSIVKIFEQPKADFERQITDDLQVLCQNDTNGFLNITQYPDSDGLFYSWFIDSSFITSDSNLFFSFDTFGALRIKLAATNSVGCTDTAEKTFTVFSKQNVIIDEIEKEMTIGESEVINARNVNSYSWFPESVVSNITSSSTEATIEQETYLFVRGVDQNGCVSYDSIRLFLDNSIQIFPSNVITPDGNNENDVWIIRYLEAYDQHEIEIFDRWGRSVYYTTQYQQDWGATDKDGNVLADGTYYYAIKINNDRVFRGAITIIKNQ